MSGAYKLRDFRTETIEIVCDKCSRHGKLNVARLIEKYGADMVLPELLRLIALEGNCPHVGNQFDACKAKYARNSIIAYYED